MQNCRTKRTNFDLSDLRFSKPKRFVKVENWPAGSARVDCYLAILVDDRGLEQGIRWTDGQPKRAPAWGQWARVVIGSDGKHYFASLIDERITIHSSNFQNFIELVWESPQWHQIQKMIENS